MTPDLFKGVFITCSFFLAAIFIPVIGVIFSILTPLPIIVYYYQYGRQTAFKMMGLVFLIITIFTFILKIPHIFIYLIQLLLLGAISGELLRSNFGLAKIVIVACAGAIIINSVSLYTLGSHDQRGVNHWLEGAIQKNMDQAIKQYKEGGLKEKQVQWLSKSLKTMAPWLARLFPGLIIAGTAIMIWINLLLARRFIFLRLHHVPTSLQNLTLWKTPEKMVWAVVIPGFSLLFPPESVKTAAYNILIVMAIAYFFQGLAIISYYFQQKQTPKSIRFLIYFFILFQQFFALMVTAIGFADVWANFRKIPDTK